MHTPASNDGIIGSEDLEVRKIITEKPKVSKSKEIMKKIIYINKIGNSTREWYFDKKHEEKFCHG